MLSRASRIKDLLKEAAVSVEKQESRDKFSELFPVENANMMFSFSDQYYSAFRSNFGSNEEYLQSINQFKGKPKEEIIAAIRSGGVSKSPKDLEIDKANATHPQLKDPEHVKGLETLKKSEVNPRYYPWIFKMLFNEEADPIEEIIKSVLFYQRNPEQLEKPLESFNLLSELRSYFDEKLASNKEYYYSKIEKHALDPKYTDYIYQSDDFITVLSGTTQSSQYWARGTTWCTSYLKGNKFANYASKNIYLYYVITKQDSEFFEKSNPMRKISIGFTKRDGKPQLLTNQNATVNTDNRDLSLNQIQEYLGSEADSIISAIYADIGRREDTKFNKIIAETTPEELELQIAAINDDSQIASILLQFTQNNAARADTKKVAAKNLAEKSPEEFFGYGLHKTPEYAEFKIPAAKNCAEKDPICFFHYDLHEIPEYAEFGIPAAKNLVEKKPKRFFSYGLHKLREYVEFGIPTAKYWAEKDPEEFFYYGLHNIPEYAHLNPKNKAPEENKLQPLEAWLRTNGFRKEAKELSALLC
jgi:hypothetical protein